MDHEKRVHLLSIGEMAEANRVSIATLRLYDRMGLLQPSYRDEETNYRYYDIRQTSRLATIRYMRNLNMSLTDIQTLLEKEDIMLIEQKLIEKNNQIHQQMRDLKAMHEAVERTIQSIERYRKSPVSGTISLEFIDQRHILYIPCAENFYEQGIKPVAPEDLKDAMAAGDSLLTAFLVTYLSKKKAGECGEAAIRESLDFAAGFAAETCKIEGSWGHPLVYEN